jgi:hypothetical protein
MASFQTAASRVGKGMRRVAGCVGCGSVFGSGCGINSPAIIATVGDVI